MSWAPGFADRQHFKLSPQGIGELESGQVDLFVPPGPSDETLPHTLIQGKLDTGRW